MWHVRIPAQFGVNADTGSQHMSAQFSPELPERTKQSAVHRGTPVPFFYSHPGGRSAPFLQLQGTLGNRRVAELIQAKRLTPEGRIIDGGATGRGMGCLRPKPAMDSPEGQYEQEASHIAREMMGRPNGALASAAVDGPMRRAGVPGNTAPEEAEKERDKLLQAKPAASSGESFEAGEEVESRVDRSKGGGSPLPEAVRSFMEPRFGVDFSQVRAHTGADAVRMNRDVGAQAFTHGADIYYGAGHSPEDLALTAHELTHVVQQTGAFARKKSAGPYDAISSKSPGNSNGFEAIQRRLVTFGTLPDVNALLGLFSPRAGLTLALNVANNQVQINAVLPAPPPSPTLRNRLTTIINHATQHAEVIVARGQPQVFVGAFPQPSDLTVTRTQQIDIDDILAIEAGAPGNGVAVAIHEIEENFQAHGTVPVAGTDRFGRAHQQAITLAENPVAAELVGAGRRIAFVQVPGTIVPGFVLPFFGPIPGFINPLANTTATFVDYENYYLGITSRFVAATQDSQVVNAQRFPQAVVSARTIDNFVSGSGALPAGGAAIIAAATADVAANPTATVHIRGFTDNTGGAAVNLTVSGARATAVQGALQAAGIGQGRLHAEGLGATNFLNANANAADRAANRRVVITVVRPQL
jgi:outer membrane protein OmpA-like peptidoglycan-associated protein